MKALKSGIPADQGQNAEATYEGEAPGTGYSHFATTLAVEAVRFGKLVFFIRLADLVAQLAKGDREGLCASVSAPLPIVAARHRRDQLIAGHARRPKRENPRLVYDR